MSDHEHRDTRATRAPDERPPEEEADEGGPGESHGPLGNPASDEESLRHRQQEGAEPRSSRKGSRSEGDG